MPMLKDPSLKYEPFKPINITNRQWPSETIKNAPRWLSTDLRDGNQSLAYPMTIEQKWKYFQMLIKIGFKEIDISFPSASDTEFNFTRRLVETPHAVPDDVWLQVLSPCKKEHIRRTVDSVKGARNVILSLYIAASDNFLETIFALSQQQVLDIALDCVTYARSITKDDPSQSATRWNLMFSPEAFSDTDIEYSVRLSEAVKAAWAPTEDDPMILNLPATVEMASPNVFADQVELYCRSITDQEKVVVSLHPHNDRGCAVAASELGLMAGASRVEGCLFGNGERTGNVDLVTLALNLYTQGIDPNLDFSDLKAIKAVYEECTRIKIPMRMPYSGDSVFIAYSGSHQDAINKGFVKIQKVPEGKRNLWKVPYLAIDPQDIGATYESVIRVNSQSGKGGVAWTLSRQIQLDLPRGLQIAFSKIVKSVSDTLCRTMTPTEISNLFFQAYYVLSKDPRIFETTCSSMREGEKPEDIVKTIHATIFIDGKARRLSGDGIDVISAVKRALSVCGIQGLSFSTHERTLITGSGALRNISIVECRPTGTTLSSWGVNMSANEDQRLLLACLSSALGVVSKVPVPQRTSDIIGRDLRLLHILNGRKITEVV